MFSPKDLAKLIRAQNVAKNTPQIEADLDLLESLATDSDLSTDPLTAIQSEAKNSTPKSRLKRILEGNNE